MKLIIITAVSSFEKAIKKALKQTRVSTFSYTRVTGYKELVDLPMDDNWFSSSVGEHDSILFYAFVQNELVDDLIRVVDGFNEEEESGSHIHIAVMDIVKQNRF